jgi:type I restriction enzyme S subunit
MNTSTIRFKALEGISDLRFLWVWLGSSEFRSQITRRVTGSAQQNFGPSHLKSLIITLPPLPVQERFATQVEAIGQLRSLQQIQRDDLDALFASVQYRAFRGEL